MAAIGPLLPRLQALLAGLLEDRAAEALGVQRQELKVYWALTQQQLPLNLIGRDVFASWMELLRRIAEAELPDGQVASIPLS